MKACKTKIFYSDFKNFVITAAHCCADQNKDTIKVVAGDHNIKLDEGTEQVGYWSLKTVNTCLNIQYSESEMINRWQ